jgi:hypothetical protein
MLLDPPTTAGELIVERLEKEDDPNDVFAQFVSTTLNELAKLAWNDNMVGLPVPDGRRPLRPI